MAGEGRFGAGAVGDGVVRHRSLDDRFDPAVRIVDHSTAWARFALQELARIKSELGPLALRLDHIGSTAVPGLAAKPILDLQLCVADVDDGVSYVAALQGLGYLFVPGTELPEAQFFAFPPARPRTHHLHVFRAGSDHAARHLAVRDFLRSHPAEVARYAGLKRDLVRQHPEDRLAYIDGKAPYMAELERRALTWVASVDAPRQPANQPFSDGW